jgi:nucleotide-binding universal stress UspA family protein
VLVARAGVEPGAFPRSIVAGVDGSTPSLWAAAVAQDVGTRLGVPVRLLAAGGAGPHELDLAALEESGLTVEHAESKPVDALLEATAEADLVVVGSRGVRGLKALGSVSERVAHQATCSVLVLRSAA